MSDGKLVSALVLVAALAGCSPQVEGGGARDLGGGTGDLASADQALPCVNLQCKQQACTGAAPTKITGKVLAPSLGDPIPGALVYVPNAPVAAFTPGIVCEACNLSGSPLVMTTSGTDGSFTLENVPVGTAIPIVIQSGRWRRQVTLDVTACTTNALPADLGRMPRDHTEGDIPKMALVTGSMDPLECTLAKLLDPAEITAPSGSGRVHLYKQNGNDLATPLPLRATLVGSASTLSQYDAVLLPCPSKESYTDVEAGNLKAYADGGGRVFNTHGGGFWMLEPTNLYGAMVTWNNQNDPAVNMATIDQTFGKGMIFAQWLLQVGTSTALGTMPISSPQWFVDAVQAPAQRWVYTSGPTTVQHFTFNTPTTAAADKQCGRVLFSNFHVGSASAVGLFPDTCTGGPLSSNEKLIEYMLFDVTACVTPDIL